jgi:hypothetical protein
LDGLAGCASIVGTKKLIKIVSTMRNIGALILLKSGSFEDIIIPPAF